MVVTGKNCYYQFWITNNSLSTVWEGQSTPQFTPEEIDSIVQSVGARINEEALEIHWEFGVGLGAKGNLAVASGEATAKLITFNGDFQSGENYAVFREANLEGAWGIPEMIDIVEGGAYVRKYSRIMLVMVR